MSWMRAWLMIVLLLAAAPLAGQDPRELQEALRKLDQVDASLLPPEAQEQFLVARALDPQRLMQSDLQELTRLIAQDEWESAAARGETLARELEARGDASGSMHVHHLLSTVYDGLGLVTRARRAEARQLALAAERLQADPRLADQAAWLSALARAREGRVEEALRSMNEQFAQLGAEAPLRIQLLTSRAGLLLQLERAGEAVQGLADEGDRQRQARRPARAFRCYLWAAQMAEASGESENARRLGKKAVEQVAPFLDPRLPVVVMGDFSASVDHLSVAQAYGASGDYRRALELYRAYQEWIQRMGSAHIEQARALVGGSPSRELYRENALLGRWEDRAGNPSRALEHYLRCAETLQQTWSRLKLQESRESFLQGGSPDPSIPRPVEVLERLLELLIQRGEPARALELAEQFKGRMLVELLGRAAARAPSRAAPELLESERQLFRALQETPNPDRIRQYTAVIADIRKQDPEYAELLSPAPARAPELQAALDPETALLEYFVGPRWSVVWVVTPREIAALPLGTGSGELSLRVAAVRELLSAPSRGEALRAELASLSRELLGPALSRVAAARRLVVVPHGPLHGLPFGVLLDAEGKYLLESHEVAGVPSASVLRYCQQKNARRTGGFQPAQAPGVAYALGSASRGSFSPLPGTSQEIQAIGKVFPKVRLREGPELKLETVRGELPGSAIIHFATHGFFDQGNPTDSGLVLVDGDLSVRAVLDLRLQAYSVVLSACDTGLARVRPGDEVVGLNRAFLYAGTPAVVSTLWKVADEPSALLMASFYRNLPGMGRSAALRGAQLEIRSRKEYSHPFYWGAYAVCGDWL